MTETGPDRAGSPIPNGDRARDLLELADALMERARTLASQSDQLIAALDDAARRLVESGHGVEASAPLPAPLRLLKRAETNGKPPSTNGAAEDPVSEGALLLITRMSVAGSAHDEIARRLREDYGIEDASEMLERAGL
jgi:hypothetical protein